MSRFVAPGHEPPQTGKAAGSSERRVPAGADRLDPAAYPARRRPAPPISAAQPAASSRRPGTDTSSLFARFPHLSRIELLWGSRECRVFLANLILDTRGGTRQGFPLEHASAIFRLLAEHDAAFPQFEAVADSWKFD